MTTKELTILSLTRIEDAAKRIEKVVYQTPLHPNRTFSETFDANVSFKREDLQPVRSYKIRGAFNKMSQILDGRKANGVVCASAGNHAQGVALACDELQIKGTIFMPTPTPKQKVEQVKFFGKDSIDVVLIGDTFDDAYEQAIQYCTDTRGEFVHPFDDEEVMCGQGTVGLEILRSSDQPIDYLFLPVGGGGLASGVASVFKQLSPQTKLIGVEPAGAPAMKRSIEEDKHLMLEEIDKFVDGAAVQSVGQKTLQVCKHLLDQVITVKEGKICATMLELYNREAIVVEPAGALSVAALDQFKSQIKGKNVVCVLSGSNNDISRMEEIKERALLYEGLKHYFIVRFPQRAGALKEFLVDVLGPTDDIVLFEYTKKNARENGPALIGIEHQHTKDFEPLMQRMKAKRINMEYLNNRTDLFQYIL